MERNLSSKDLKRIMFEEYVKIIIENINKNTNNNLYESFDLDESEKGPIKPVDSKKVNNNSKKTSEKNSKETTNEKDEEKSEKKRKKKDNYSSTAKIKFKVNMENDGEVGPVVVIPAGLAIRDKEGIDYTVKEISPKGVVVVSQFEEKPKYVLAKDLEKKYEIT